MKGQISRCGWGPASLHGVALLILMFSVSSVEEATRAQARTSASTSDVQVPDWSPTLFADPVARLAIVQDGTLFAQTTGGLVASADAGATWSQVPLPPQLTPPATIVAADPTDSQVIYATGQELLYRSADGGMSWRRILPRSTVPPVRSPTGGADVRVIGLAVSWADHSLLYAVVAGTPAPGNQTLGNSSYALLRTTDGGNTWAVLDADTYGGRTCRWYLDLLYPHPIDPRRLYLARSCRSAAVDGDVMEESTDGGASFHHIDYVPPSDQSAGRQFVPFGYPRALSGGSGVLPTRWYLAINRDTRKGGGALLRSDDDGMNWATILNYEGGGSSMTYAIPGTWDVRIRGLAYDPAKPDHVLVARTASEPYDSSRAYSPAPITSGVTESPDGGRSWNDLGSQQIGAITDLALSPDGTRLYVASDQGVRMMTLHP